MALLSSRNTVLATATLLVTGCALLRSLTDSPERFAFSHATHVIGEKMACVSCHANLARSDDPGMPAPDTCAVCHEESDAEAPPERRVALLFEGETYRARHAAELGAEPIFSHKLHAKDAKACGECHTDIENDAAITESIGVDMARCMECHAERHVANECSTCHTEITPEWEPPSHALQWMVRHGRAVNACPEDAANSCELCHTERTCVECHRDQAPASHNTFFVQRGHGLIAQMDRASCATCHAPDSCDACHRVTEPRSHVGSFGGVRSNHCVSCHLPLADNGCIVCHKSTPSHSSATAMPSWHVPSMNCRQCHGTSEPLPHADNGDDCNACHH